MNNAENELKRLKFEDMLWIIFGILCFINIYGDKLQETDIYNNSKMLEKSANNIFTFTLIVTFFIYVYFFIRNYNNYENASSDKKELYTIKVFGSIFLIVVVVCLIYFQTHNKNAIGAPSL